MLVRFMEGDILSDSNGGFRLAGSANSTWFNSYHSYADHLQFLRDLQASYPTRSEIVVAGNSGQGRPITGIHFYGSGGKGSRPAIVFHGTVHAREWITTMVTEYMAFNLLSNYATNAEIRSFVDKYDFYIFPVVNVCTAGFNILLNYADSCTSIARWSVLYSPPVAVLGF